MEITQTALSMPEEGPSNFRAQRQRGESASSEARGHNYLTPVMKYMPPPVLVFVSLIYQDKTKNPFLENPIPVWCFLIDTCVFWLLVGAMKEIKTTHQELHQKFSQFAVASGVHSIISIMSIFIPYAFSLVTLVIWVPPSVGLAWPILSKACNLLKRGITNVFGKLNVITISDAYNLLKRGIRSVFKKLHAVTTWARGLSPTEDVSSPE